MSAPNERVYRKLYISMHCDRRVRALSPEPPSGRGLWWHLLAGQHTGVIPGILVIGRHGFAESLGWTVEAFDEAFDEAFRQGMVAMRVYCYSCADRIAVSDWIRLHGFEMCEDHERFPLPPPDAALPRPLRGVHEVVGYVSGVGFEPGNTEVRLTDTAEQAYACRASDDLVATALRLRGTVVRAMVLDDSPRRLLWLRPADAPAGIADHEARITHIHGRWAGLLARLAT